MAFYEMLPGAGMPPGLQAGMDSVLNKKFGTSTTYPAEGWPDTVNLMGPLPEKTVSGAIVTFSDGADGVPLKKCEITLSASLDGYSAVDVVATGKNILPMVNYDGGVYNPDIDRVLNLSVSETQFTKNGNVYSVTTSVAWKTFTVLFPIISGVTYYEKWTLSIESGQQGFTRAYLDDNFKVLAKYNNNSSDPITTNGVMSPPTGAKYLAITWTNRGTAVQTLNITEPMIEIGSSASAWEEYSGTNYTTSLGRTIYGGQVDIVNGVGTDENNKFTVTSDMADSIRYIGSGDTAYIQINKTPKSNNRWQDLVCSHFTPDNIYAGGTQQGIGCYSTQFYIRDSRFTSKQDFLDFLTEQETLGTPLEICYKLATPETFTFDPVPIDSKLGNNTLWSEQGSSAEVTYRADINLALGGN